MLVQPADVSWNKPFKASYTELYEAWLSEPGREADVTKTGNARAPSRAKMVQWIKEAWNRVPAEVVRTSFEACGITSHDVDVIHCTKIGGVAEASREHIQQMDISDVDLDMTQGEVSSDDDSASETDSDEIDLERNE